MDFQMEKPVTLCWTPAIGHLVDLALQEDLGNGDVTTDILGDLGQGKGIILCREPMVMCGLPVIEWVLDRVGLGLSLERSVQEGEEVKTGAVLAQIHGSLDAILRIERTLLNFLMRLSGVATLARRYRNAVQGTGARIVDTRKTMPGWRILDKYAVRIGGGDNHRADLGSGILIKDNHIAACGSVGAAVRLARERAPHPLRIEVEVESVAAAQEAIDAGAEILLLDNMTPDQVREAVQAINGRALIEVSGGVTLQTVRFFAEAGAQIISVGALTHSVPAVDLSLEIEGIQP